MGHVLRADGALGPEEGDPGSRGSVTFGRIG
jgi:hypothetical protein